MIFEGCSSQTALRFLNLKLFLNLCMLKAISIYTNHEVFKFQGA